MMGTPGMRVIRPGLQATLQDWPGRIGYRRVGIPPSGPMDSLSFRLANRLVGNDPGALAMEYQYVGPELECLADVSVALTGGESAPTLDGEPMPMGRVVAVRKGQRLACGVIRKGARSYLAIAGAFAVNLVLGSGATFPRANIGGLTLVSDDVLAFAGPEIRSVGLALRGEPLIESGDPLAIEVVAGPHLDWLSETGLAQLTGERWKVSSRSDRTGIRLEGPALDFSRRAYEKAPEHGTDPTNVINTGYPIGGVNICGDTPIVLPMDGPSQGGFITPIVVASAALRKVGQLRPNQTIVFRRITLDEAAALRAADEARAMQDLSGVSS